MKLIAKRQFELPIDEIKVNRICQFGACHEDVAFVINGVDLCFEHGKAQLGIKMVNDGKKYEIYSYQLELK